MIKRIRYILKNRYKKVEKPEKNDIPLQSQIRRLRIFLLASIMVFTMYDIRFQNLYFEIWEYYQWSVDSNHQLLEQYQEMTEMSQQISKYYQETLRLSQEMLRLSQEMLCLSQEISEAVQNILDILL